MVKSLGLHYDEFQIMELFSVIDKTNDYQISFKEFQNLVAS